MNQTSTHIFPIKTHCSQLYPYPFYKCYFTLCKISFVLFSIPVCLEAFIVIRLRGPLHEQTQTGLSFRSAWVHFGVWSKSLECLHESRRNETRAGLGSFRSFRPIWKLRSTWNSHVNRNFFRSGRNESCEENCGGDIASFGAIFISVVHFVIHTHIAVSPFHSTIITSWLLWRKH